MFNRLELVLNMLNTWAQAAVKQVFNRCSTGVQQVFNIDTMERQHNVQYTVYRCRETLAKRHIAIFGLKDATSVFSSELIQSAHKHTVRDKSFYKFR